MKVLKKSHLSCRKHLETVLGKEKVIQILGSPKSSPVGKIRSIVPQISTSNSLNANGPVATESPQQPERYFETPRGLSDVTDKVKSGQSDVLRDNKTDSQLHRDDSSGVELPDTEVQDLSKANENRDFEPRSSDEEAYLHPDLVQALSRYVTGF